MLSKVGVRVLPMLPTTQALTRTSGVEVADQGGLEPHLGSVTELCDAVQVRLCSGRPEGVIASVTADGAYDGEPINAVVAARQSHPPPEIVVPHRASAVPSTDEGDCDGQSPRHCHIHLMAERGRMGWQRASGMRWRRAALCLDGMEKV